MPGTFYKETDILVRELAKKKVLFLTHVRPDLDTLASAYALTHFLGQHTPCEWGIVKKLNDSYTQRISDFTLQPLLVEKLDSYDVVVCVDFRSPVQAGPLEDALVRFNGKIIILDHHHPSGNEFSKKTIQLIRPSSVAVAQMVAQIGIELDADFTKPVASALAMAILTDSARFTVANTETFTIMGMLLEKSGKTFEQLSLKAIPPQELENNVSVFHALRQTKLFGVGKYLLAQADAPYHNAPSANALIQLGADVALGIFSSTEGLFCTVRVSGRAHSVLQLDAMKILLPLAQKNGGNCGGHARAAQLNLPPYLSESIVTDAFTRELLMRVCKTDPKARVRIY